MSAPSRDRILTLDCSTTAAKAIVWDRRGSLLAEGRSEIGLHAVGQLGFEQDAEQWWSASRAAIREAVTRTDPSRLACLCITHQRETFVVADRDGHPQRPAIVWMDERCRGQVEALRRRGLGERLHAISGKPASTTPSFAKLLWLREHEPQWFGSGAMFLDVHAFLVHRLLNEMSTSLPSADPTGMVDLRTGAWSAEILELAGVQPGQLPLIAQSGSVLGGLMPAAAEACGLPAGLPLIAGAGDGQAAGLGAGLLEPGRAYLNLGTAVVSGIMSDSFQISPAFRTLASAAPGRFVLETDLKGGSFTLNWLVERWIGAGRPPGAALAALEREAQSLPAGSQGLVVIPYWCGVMNPYWDDRASGLVMGWRDTHGPVHLYRAILEGIALEQRLQTTAVEQAIGRPVDGFVVMGGGASSDLWCQILADACGRPIWRAASQEATSLGAAVLGAWAVGFYEDIERAAHGMTSTGATFTPGPQQEEYERLYREVYRDLYPAVRPFMDRLAG